jgi:hypothetical protein
MTRPDLLATALAIAAIAAAMALLPPPLRHP